MITLTIILLQSGGAGLINLVFIAAMFLIFWLFLIRPQAKKQKEQKAFLDSIQKGDEVATSSGLLGRINKLEDDVVTLEVGTKTYVRVIKSAISKEMTEQAYASDDQDKK